MFMFDFVSDICDMIVVINGSYDVVFLAKMLLFCCFKFYFFDFHNLGFGWVGRNPNTNY